MHPLDALAVIVILSLWTAAIVESTTRKPRHDASAERANADRFTINEGRN